MNTEFIDVDPATITLTSVLHCTLSNVPKAVSSLNKLFIHLLIFHHFPVIFFGCTSQFPVLCLSFSLIHTSPSPSSP